MNRFITIYYFLFVLLIMGGFSSMAQNDYGNTILGGVAAAFLILFALQWIQAINSKIKANLGDSIELISLTIISLILALRVFYIHFRFVEIIFVGAGLSLVTVYIIKLVHAWRLHNARNKWLALALGAFYGSITLYILSMAVVPFFPFLAEPSGITAFVLLITFVAVGFVKKSFIANGEKVSMFQVAARLKDQSVVLATLFLIFTSYTGLARIGALPHLYSDEYPQVFFELVNKAESGEEKTVNGVYRHEEFKKAYDRFIDRNNAAK